MSQAHILCTGALCSSTSCTDVLCSVQTAVLLLAPVTVSHQDSSLQLGARALGGTSLTCNVCADDLAMPTELQCLIAEMNWDV